MYHYTFDTSGANMLGSKIQITIPVKGTFKPDKVPGLGNAYFLCYFPPHHLPP